MACVRRSPHRSAPARLKVIAASSMSRFKGAAVDPQQVGRELGVRTVVTGRIVQQGDTLAVSAELVSVADGAQLWGGSFVRPMSDLLVVQDDLAAQIALALRPSSPSPIAMRSAAATPTTSWRTSSTSRGVTTGTREACRGSRRHRVLQAGNPRGPRVRPRLRRPRRLLRALGAAEYGAEEPREALPKARAAAERAIDLDPRLAERTPRSPRAAHLRLGSRRRRALAAARDRAGALVCVGTSVVRRDPRRARAPARGRGRDQAGARARPAFPGDQRRPRPARRTTPAITSVPILYYQATLAMEPLFVPARLGLALALSQLGDHEQALARSPRRAPWRSTSRCARRARLRPGACRAPGRRPHHRRRARRGGCAALRLAVLLAAPPLGSATAMPPSPGSARRPTRAAHCSARSPSTPSSTRCARTPDSPSCCAGRLGAVASPPEGRAALQARSRVPARASCLLPASLSRSTLRSVSCGQR